LFVQIAESKQEKFMSSSGLEATEEDLAEDDDDQDDEDED